MADDAVGGSSAPATDAAAALLAQFVRAGVHHVVLSPGSRSQALALIAAELADAGLIDLHVRIDERVAGFTALGIGRETRVPAAVICTSGTAVANLLPAVLEAHHSGVPLLLLTADRPPELRGVGANQATRQPGLFVGFVRLDVDAPTPEATDADGMSAATAEIREIAEAAFDAARGGAGRTAGPVHLNLPYREPLSGASPTWLVAAATASARAAAPAHAADPDDASTASGAHYQGGGGIGEAEDPTGSDAMILERGPRTLVLAGADAGPAAEELAHRGGWPLVAEIVSGARFGRNLVHGYRALLSDPDLGGAVERVVVFGHPTLSREAAALLSRTDVDVVAVRGPGEALNLNGSTASVASVDVAAGGADRDWLGAWLRASRAAAVDLTPAAPDAEKLASAVPTERRDAMAAELAVLRAPLDRAALVDAVWRASWPHDRLVFASSRLVRVADTVLGGKKIPVHANRGLAGIDGILATAMGVALASQRDEQAGLTRLVTGDLSFLHDIGALLLPAAEGEPRIQVIVGNDGGGTIFDGLEVARTAPREVGDRVLYTPHEVRLEQLATAYGWEYRRATTRSALDQALTSPVGGRQIIEVPLGR
ncbi:2-succinyl-5-enolpyruvyl-6-hydroxy-3-cyclohexene-1-carboxylic-acid synthase [Microbacterium radiodurans]|uniref:2-succinyl-5-enolpyruvyl-6-hydroxy-3-cyclohexene-1-carboxylate synthase n=1 Tax=Microbacterium radiodurans TaxID=661398 RepID=A0A5J5IX23_9MICO|nr:2-succinyl-5-enolpyruvyl-6-hydroxy-3-cyclohexene-1-carboxylic-acid synthase [Microbacterium radiodurans]KAA9089836.1 2-succinyl-5-enolpyruvyl-6-hydroxy-3-cyclohexene-1-carboxylic-acid synthase [Microbacterium radiodurans]